MTALHYAGGELEIFYEAERWKRYVHSQVAPFIHGHVLEVGAGIGGTTRLFAGGSYDAWVCVEPDPQHAAHLGRLVARGELPPASHVVQGTLKDVDRGAFDAILYADVLEHIEDDQAELAEAARRLAAGGHLIVVAPAHAALFSPFDREVGHHRRYTRQSLRAIAPPNVRPVRERYLDCVGVTASLANRAFLRQSRPTRREILIWDRVLVRASEILDPLLSYAVGKSLFAVWRRLT